MLFLGREMPSACRPVDTPILNEKPSGKVSACPVVSSFCYATARRAGSLRRRRPERERSGLRARRLVPGRSLERSTPSPSCPITAAFDFKELCAMHDEMRRKKEGGYREMVHSEAASHTHNFIGHLPLLRLQGRCLLQSPHLRFKVVVLETALLLHLVGRRSTMSGAYSR